MATYSATRAVTKDLTGGTADTVTLTGAGTSLRLTNLEKTSASGHAIYFYPVPYGSTPVTATEDGNDCYSVAHGMDLIIPWTGAGAVVSVFAANNAEYSVSLL